MCRTPDTYFKIVSDILGAAKAEIHKSPSGDTFTLRIPRNAPEEPASDWYERTQKIARNLEEAIRKAGGEDPKAKMNYGVRSAGWINVPNRPECYICTALEEIYALQERCAVRR